MLFKSTHVAKTWDAWACHHQGIYYLYYLTSEHYPGDGFGLATSQDGVHWTDHGRVLVPSDAMVRYLGSGSVWKDAHFAQNGRFICNYSEWRAEGTKNVQNILFAWSRDLIHWTKFGDDYIFKIDERYYKRIEVNARGPWEDPRWDNIDAIPRPGGGYYGYWTATPKDFLGFGFGQSDDGLHWEALEPPHIEWGDTPHLYFLEVGGVRELDGHYFAMLADYSSVYCGVYSFVSESPAEPFHPAARNFSLLRNQSKMHAYFTRFVDSPDGVLVLHHTIAEGQFSDEHFTVYYAPFKRARVIDGALYFSWWNGNEKLKGRSVSIRSASEPLRFEPEKGIVLEGQMHTPARLIVGSTGDLSTAIQVSESGMTEIGAVGEHGTAFKCDERVDREMMFGPASRFRLLLHHNMLEFYIDDIFIQAYTMSTTPDGMIRCENMSDLQLWQWT